VGYVTADGRAFVGLFIGSELPATVEWVKSATYKNGWYSFPHCTSAQDIVDVEIQKGRVVRAWVADGNGEVWICTGTQAVEGERVAGLTGVSELQAFESDLFAKDASGGLWLARYPDGDGPLQQVVQLWTPEDEAVTDVARLFPGFHLHSGGVLSFLTAADQVETLSMFAEQTNIGSSPYGGGWTPPERQGIRPLRTSGVPISLQDAADAFRQSGMRDILVERDDGTLVYSGVFRDARGQSRHETIELDLVAGEFRELGAGDD